ncbi:glycosyltransferase family 4 protein [Agromyces atrinae]|uniref:glycosyltransferase family 4 protein n=1 Tax=Agromyces atrinae TaxID=592376 RepID=UPI0013E92DEA|nr:glycosyltransferase [Agromyces atrinae]
MSAGKIQVVHFGPLGDLPGGMAQVVNEYLSWEYTGLNLSGVRTTKGRGDRLSVFRWLRSLGVVLAMAFRRDRVALVHISARGSFIREGSLVVLARMAKVPVGIHLHGSEFAKFAAKSPRLVSFVCRSALTVFVLTDESKGIVERLVGGSGVRVVKTVNAIRIPSRSAVKQKNVLFCGEVGHRKGVDVLLEAWAKSIDSMDGWKLTVAGPMASGFHVSDIPRCAELVGAVPHNESMKLQAQAAIAVLPSRHEALPMFLIESMANGCVPVGTPVGQVAELIEGIGDVVPVGDADALSQSLISLATSTDLEDRSDAARSRVQTRYSVENVRSDLEHEWTAMSAR